MGLLIFKEPAHRPHLIYSCGIWYTCPTSQDEQTILPVTSTPKSIGKLAMFYGLVVMFQIWQILTNSKVYPNKFGQPSLDFELHRLKGWAFSCAAEFWNMTTKKQILWYLVKFLFTSTNRDSLKVMVLPMLTTGNCSFYGCLSWSERKASNHFMIFLGSL